MSYQFCDVCSAPPPAAQKWERFFKFIRSNIESPEVIWNNSTRRELIFAVEEEMSAFERVRVGGAGCSSKPMCRS